MYSFVHVEDNNPGSVPFAYDTVLLARKKGSVGMDLSIPGNGEEKVAHMRVRNVL